MPRSRITAAVLLAVAPGPPALGARLDKKIGVTERRPDWSS
jgi:hypothetical protein